MSREPPLLEVRAVGKRFVRRAGWADRLLGRHDVVTQALDGVDLRLHAGETLGIVGESGCGKSTLARCIAGLTTPDAGTIELRGSALEAGRRSARHRAIQLVFQDPYSSLNPRLTARAALLEVLQVREPELGAAERMARVAELLHAVGLEPVLADALPHALSGGQRQRVSIARALAARPEILVADEPVAALDVSVQAQVINTLAQLRARGLSMIFVSHDLSLVRHICDRVVVMYLGRVVEEQPTADLFRAPAHPYTRALLASVPDPDPARRMVWTPLEGEAEGQAAAPGACAFSPRCPWVHARCRTEAPALHRAAGERAGSEPPAWRVRCHDDRARAVIDTAAWAAAGETGA